MRPLRVVLDTNVLVAALRSNQGASRKLLEMVLDRRLTMLASVPLMIEYEAVLCRPEQLASSGLAVRDISALLDALAKLADQVELWFQWRPRLHDPNDEMVLETAVNGGADRLVTFNLRHLQPANEFGILVVTPPELWRELKPHEKK